MIGAPGQIGSDSASESQIRKSGRQLIFSLYGALRSVKLYPPENAAVQKALSDVSAQSRELIGDDGELELKMSGEFIFVNQTRLRLDLDNFAFFIFFLLLFRAAGVGSVTIAKVNSAKDWLIFLSLLQAPGTDDADERLLQLLAKLSSAGVTSFPLAAPTEQGETNREKAKERAK